MIGSKRVLITGANGMLGSSLMKKLNCENLYGFSVQDMDITNRENVQAILTKVAVSSDFSENHRVGDIIGVFVSCPGIVAGTAEL